MLIILNEEAGDEQLALDFVHAIEDAFQFWSVERIFGNNESFDKFSTERARLRSIWLEGLRT